ncbi:Sec-independent protein translocase subunit TatA [Streptomyces sp. NRRL F-5135]|uniref:Sec-independent protein translocase subunit TatA n=1 Tax=Streptomyces sp. NRRL F-5135 TaxID=1463858 RepID=UPI0004C560EB|nr:Sec-independent protein translocase subunit TatA [Streptomyces sp. NRRL F-5135]
MLRNGLEPWHLLIVAIVVILLFGSKRLPDTARSLGKSLRILKSETKAMKGDAAERAPSPDAPPVRTVTATGAEAEAVPREERTSKTP